MSEVKIFYFAVSAVKVPFSQQDLSTALVAAGYDVKMSEIHGMSQRGGSVVTQVRYGDKVYSPIIGKEVRIFWSPLRRWKPCVI